jgi:hypothetical protein
MQRGYNLEADIRHLEQNIISYFTLFPRPDIDTEVAKGIAARYAGVLINMCRGGMSVHLAMISLHDMAALADAQAKNEGTSPIFSVPLDTHLGIAVRTCIQMHMSARRLPPGQLFIPPQRQPPVPTRILKRGEPINPL